ncbi:MAG: CHASE domain-containing protein [Thermodesulfobacteriota bacterium]
MESGFERAAEARSVAVKEEIDKDLMRLQSLAAFHKSSERITRQQFQTFAQTLSKDGGGIQALEWIPRVSDAERARYEEEARLEGFPNFRITEMNAEGKLIPAASRPEYYPVFYVEPYAGNEAAIGFDLASDPVRKEALDSAMETGEMVASEPLVLVQETGHQYGFLVFLPVYRTKATPETVQERRANLAGFYLGVFRVDDLMEQAWRHIKHAEIDCLLLDLKAPAANRVIHLHKAGMHETHSGHSPESDINRSRIKYETDIPVAGRDWKMVCWPTQGFIESGKSWFPWMVLIGSVLFTGLMTRYVWLVTASGERAARFAEEQLEAKQELESQVQLRTRAEELVRKERDTATSYLGIAGVMILALDRNGRITLVNKRGCEILEREQDELVGRDWFATCVPENERAGVKSVFANLMAGRVDAEEYHENPILTGKGEERLIAWRNALIRDEHGNILGTLSSGEDITERKRSQEALAFERAQLLSIFDSINEIIFVVDAETYEVLFVNRYQRELLKSDPIGAKCYQAFYGTDKPCSSCPNEIIRQLNGTPYYWEHQVDNPPRQLLIMDRMIKWPDGRDVKFELAIDITERKQAEQRVRASEERMRTVIEAAPVGVMVARNELTVYANSAFATTFGYDDPRELIGVPVETFLAPEARSVLDQKASHFEMKGQKKNGDLFDFAAWSTTIDYEGAPAVLEFVVDLSETKTLRAQLYQAQKMEAIGALAAGVAHDFNNLLTVVNGYAELLITDKAHDDPDYEDLEKIYSAGHRGADLVKRLLTFSRRAESNPKPLNLNHQIEQVKTFLDRTIPKMIAIELSLSENLPAINADPTQIEQILMNLAVNGKDAMPEGGKLIIETRNVILDPDYCRLHVEAKPGPHVMLSVSDTGHGMDQETVDRIFEPFFTTKEPGKGTGLGLAMVFGIVKQHGGHVTCYSERGNGTTFKIYFPIIGADAEEDKASEAPLPSGGAETILLVDDEPAVRDLGQKILERAGYTILTAANGKEALELYAGQKDRVALVLLDLIMPEMGGRQCCEELRRVRPGVKVVIASGYSSGGTMNIATELGARGFIRKPYDARQLLQTVRNALDTL